MSPRHRDCETVSLWSWKCKLGQRCHTAGTTSERSWAWRDLPCRLPPSRIPALSRHPGFLSNEFSPASKSPSRTSSPLYPPTHTVSQTCAGLALLVLDTGKCHSGGLSAPPRVPPSLSTCPLSPQRCSSLLGCELLEGRDPVGPVSTAPQPSLAPAQGECVCVGGGTGTE